MSGMRDQLLGGGFCDYPPSLLSLAVALACVDIEARVALDPFT